MIKKNCRHITSLFIFLLIISAKSFAGDVDSLKKILTTKIDDSVRVNVLNALSRELSHTNSDSAILVAAEAKALAEKNDYKSGLALAHKNIGIGYYLKSDYKNAILSWQAAIDVYKAKQDRKGVANMLSNMGGVYFNQGDDAKALELHLESLKISEEINDSLRILTSLINIGGVYQNKKATYQKALDYFLRSYKLSKQVKDYSTMGASAVNLGETYYKLGDDSTALIYLYESEKAYKDEPENLPYSLNIIGRVYTRQKKYEAAVQIHSRAYELAKQLDIKLDQTQSLVGLGQAYSAKGENTLAVEAYKTALDIGTPLSALTEMKDAYEGLSGAYSKLKDYTNAYKYQELLIAIKDEIYNVNIDKKLGTLQFGFEMEKKEVQIKQNENEIDRQKKVKYSFIGGFAVMVLFASVFFAQRNRIKKAKKRSDELLLNILPEETAEELKETGTAKTKSLDSITVLFTDFKNFTIASEKLTPEELVAEINYCYSAFDHIVEKYGIEKIKTIGDSYMCAGGLPVPNTTHPFDVVKAGLEMVKFIEDNKQERLLKGLPYFELRCGIHTGPVVAGIVGIKKFAYDIWGDTVNTASRMESSGGVGKVNISGITYEIVKDQFNCTHRGKIEAKNKGSIDMYFVEGEK
jgi:adenylate cyclase